MICPKNLVLYLATIYGSTRQDILVQEGSLFIFRKQAALFNISGTPFHYNLGLKVLDNVGALYTHPCFQLRPSSPMREVLRVGSRYYVRGSHMEVREGGLFGCWFLEQGGSGAFVDTSDLLHGDRMEVWARWRSLFSNPNLTSHQVKRDKLSWCVVANKINVSGFVFGREIVRCDCAMTSSSCVPGLKYGWDADKTCDCSASTQYLRCASS